MTDHREKEDPAKKKHKAYRAAVISVLSDIVAVCIIWLIIMTCVLGITVSRGDSMSPGIGDGDIVIYLRHAEVLPSDTVVYKTDNRTFTGRVAAAPGSVISETGDHRLTVDSRFLTEDTGRGIRGETLCAEEQELPMTLDEGSYFILNDDREDMNDSRKFGAIDEDDIKGRIVTVIKRRFI